MNNSKEDKEKEDKGRDKFVKILAIAVIVLITAIILFGKP